MLAGASSIRKAIYLSNPTALLHGVSILITSPNSIHSRVRALDLALRKRGVWLKYLSMFYYFERFIIERQSVVRDEF